MRLTLSAVLLVVFLQGCGSTGPQPSRDQPAAVTQGESVANGASLPASHHALIEAGLAQAAAAFQAGQRLRPYAAVYSDLAGIRPVRLNDKDRQASDSDTDLLLESIRALSDSTDLQAFAVFGLAQDQQRQRWFVVHYENRQGSAQLRQYPLPPAPVDRWEPVLVEAVRPIIF